MSKSEHHLPWGFLPPPATDSDAHPESQGPGKYIHEGVKKIK